MKGKNIFGFILTLLVVLSAAMGTYGYCLVYDDFFNAAFNALMLFVLGIDGEAPNVWVAIARWIAPITTASGVLSAFGPAKRLISNKFKILLFKKKTVALYGPEEYIEKLQEENQIMDDYVLLDTDCGRQFVSGAGRYVLLWSDEENGQFLGRYNIELEGKEVYFLSQVYEPMISENINFHPIKEEFQAARKYWKENPLFDGFNNTNPEYKDVRVTIIGFEDLGEMIMTQGLLLNIIHPKQSIIYDIFPGEEFSSVNKGKYYKQREKFLNLHCQLDKICDEIIFHDNAWYEDKDLLKKSSRVIITDVDESARVLQDIVKSIPPKALTEARIDVFTNDSERMQKTLDKAYNINVIEYRQLSLEDIIGDRLIEAAKEYNYNYFLEYVSQTKVYSKKERDQEWDKLNSFKKYSNIASADYDVIRGLIADACDGDIDLLKELEHIRWERFHYVNNWSRATGDVTKDEGLWLHSDLVPFEELTIEEQNKDVSQIMHFIRSRKK
ncbi:MAG: hypothetical protein K5773_07470 [Pseudobutyrivibrio sp.]|nr:hypothetical protein [Pseudobutyrivibrio sp.]